ncbi:MAG: iron chaperone [Chitinophagaceae bacterium]
MKKTIASDVDSYIAGFPQKVQVMMKKLRSCIKKAAPDAEESISYMMPAYKLNGPLVYFGGYEKHIGFYPTGSGIAPFQKEISVYKHSKGAVQFPLDEPLPLDLVERMVKYRVKENLVKAQIKKQKKNSEKKG